MKTRSLVHAFIAVCLVLVCLTAAAIVWLATKYGIASREAFVIYVPVGIVLLAVYAARADPVAAFAPRTAGLFPRVELDWPEPGAYGPNDREVRRFLQSLNELSVIDWLSVAKADGLGRSLPSQLWAAVWIGLARKQLSDAMDRSMVDACHSASTSLFELASRNPLLRPDWEFLQAGPVGAPTKTDLTPPILLLVADRACHAVVARRQLPRWAYRRLYAPFRRVIPDGRLRQ